MTERFVEIISTQTIRDNETGKEYKPVLLSDDLLDFINEQDKEIKELKEAMKRLMIDMMGGR